MLVRSFCSRSLRGGLLLQAIFVLASLMARSRLRNHSPHHTCVGDRLPLSRHGAGCAGGVCRLGTPFSVKIPFRLACQSLSWELPSPNRIRVQCVAGLIFTIPLYWNSRSGEIWIILRKQMKCHILRKPTKYCAVGNSCMLAYIPGGPILSFFSLFKPFNI